MVQRNGAEGRTILRGASGSGQAQDDKLSRFTHRYESRQRECRCNGFSEHSSEQPRSRHGWKVTRDQE